MAKLNLSKAAAENVAETGIDPADDIDAVATGLIVSEALREDSAATVEDIADAIREARRDAAVYRSRVW